MRISVDQELGFENAHLISKVRVVQSGEDVTKQCSMADEQGGVTRRYVYDKDGHIVANADRTKALRKWVYGPVKILIAHS